MKSPCFASPPAVRALHKVLSTVRRLATLPTLAKASVRFGGKNNEPPNGVLGGSLALQPTTRTAERIDNAGIDMALLVELTTSQNRQAQRWQITSNFEGPTFQVCDVHVWLSEALMKFCRCPEPFHECRCCRVHALRPRAHPRSQNADAPRALR